MALRDFLFGFKFLATDYVSPVLKNIETRIEAVNSQVKNTARWREAGTNMAMVGAGVMAMGAGIGVVLKGMIDNAAEMDERWRHLTTTLDSGVAGVRELAQAHELAAKWSVQFNYAQKDIVDNLYRSMSFTGDWNSAIAVTANSLAVAKGNMGDAAQIGESLSIMFNDWPGKVGHAGEQVKRLADLVAYTSRHGAFESVNQLNAGLSAAVGSFKAAGLGPEDALAVLQAYSRVGLVGSEAGTAAMESLQAFSKGKLQKELGVALAVTKAGGLDLIGTFVNLRREVGSGVISVQQFQRASAALGIRGERAMAVDVGALVDFRKQLDSPLVIGAATQGAMTMMAAFNEQIGSLGKRWDILSEKLGGNLTGPIQAIGSAVGRVLDLTIAFATAHPQITKFVVMFAAVGAAVAVVAGGAIAAVGGLLAMGSFIGIGGGVLAVIAGIGAAIAGVTAYLYTWHPAFLATIGSIVKDVGVAILNIGKVVYDLFTGQWGKMFTDAGWNIVKALADGIWKAASLPVRAVESMLTKVRSFLPFSPAREGPLRSLNRLRIVETIAESIRPGPALTAMRRTAAAVAIAAPMTFAPMMVSPAIAGAPGGAGGGVVVQVHQEIHIDGASAADEHKLMAVLRHHGEELAQIIDGRLTHRSRRKF